MKSCLYILFSLVEECSLPEEKEYSREVKSQTLVLIDLRSSPVLLHGNWGSCTNYLTSQSPGHIRPRVDGGLNEVVYKL